MAHAPIMRLEMMKKLAKVALKEPIGARGFKKFVLRSKSEKVKS